MKGERTKLATLKSAVADIDDATRFPNIAKARAHYASLPAERKRQLETEWEYI